MKEAPSITNAIGTTKKPQPNKDFTATAKSSPAPPALPAKLKTARTAKLKLNMEPAAGGEMESIDADVVLVAIGRRPFTEGLGLETAPFDHRDGAVEEVLIAELGDLVQGQVEDAVVETEAGAQLHEERPHAGQLAQARVLGFLLEDLESARSFHGEDEHPVARALGGRELLERRG